MLDIILQIFSNTFDGYSTWKSKRRNLFRDQAKFLIEQEGPEAFDTALKLVNLAREREDEASTEMWLEIAKEISRRQKRKLPKNFLINIMRR